MSCRTKAGCGTLFGLVIRNKNEEENDELDRIVYRGSFRGGHDFLFREDQGGPGYGALSLDRRVRPGDSVEYGFAGQSRADAPIGTAYAIWTGVGALGTVLLGIFVFGESAGFARIFFIVTLFGSIVGLKLVSH